MRQPDADAERPTETISLYDRYAGTIFTYLYQHASNRQDAEDLLIEVFEAALRHLALVDLSERAQLAWLRTVARNKVIDRYRHAAVMTLLPLEEFSEKVDDELTPEERALQQERYEELYHSLKQLSPLQQQLVQLRYGNNLRLVEIAEILKKPAGTVRKMLARALEQLRGIYEQQAGGKKR